MDQWHVISMTPPPYQLPLPLPPPPLWLSEGLHIFFLLFIFLSFLFQVAQEGGRAGKEGGQGRTEGREGGRVLLRGHVSEKQIREFICMSALLSAPLIMPTEETAALSLVMCRVTELQITCVVFVSSHVLLQTFKKKKKKSTSM